MMAGFASITAAMAVEIQMMASTSRAPRNDIAVAVGLENEAAVYGGLFGSVASRSTASIWLGDSAGV